MDGLKLDLIRVDSHIKYLQSFMRWNILPSVQKYLLVWVLRIHLFFYKILTIGTTVSLFSRIVFFTINSYIPLTDFFFQEKMCCFSINGSMWIKAERKPYWTKNITHSKSSKKREKLNETEPYLVQSCKTFMKKTQVVKNISWTLVHLHLAT